MVYFHIFLAIFFLFNAIHGLREWRQSSEHDVHQSISSNKKARNDQESEELLNNYNSVTKLTLLENVYSNGLTEPANTDTKYQYNDLVLTAAITFRKESVTSEFKNTQRDDIKGYIKGPRIENKDAKKTYQGLQNIESKYSIEGTPTVSELDSAETTTVNQFWVLTTARRIYNGHKTKIMHFPFLVTVHVFRRFVCGGTIIQSNLVITAASCLKRWKEWLLLHNEKETTIDQTTTDVTTTDETTTDETTTDETTTRDTTKHRTSEEFETTLPTPKHGAISVRTGTNYYRLEGEVVQVLQVHFHPSYQEDNLQNNLAILKLERHLIFNHRNVDNIDIRTEAADVPEGTNVTIAGWGAGTYHNKIFNALWNLIQKSVLTVIDRDECIGTYTLKFVDTTNFCARNEHNEGACNGDAGNPAVIGGELVGVTSYGSPACGAGNATTVFTNLGYYTDWIEKIMADIPISKTSEENSSHSKDTNHTKHTNHTKYSKHTKHKKHTNRTKRTEDTTICLKNGRVYYSGQRYRKPSPVYYSGERYQKPSPIYYSGERYQTSSPVYYSGQRYRKPSPVYYSGERYQKPSPIYYSGERYQTSSPVYYSGQRYRKPSPVYYSGERYRKPSPIYYSGEGYRKPSPIYYSGEGYRKPSPVYNSGERYQKPSPVYNSVEKYQELMFQQSLTHWPRGYRRRFKDKLRETFTSLSRTHSLKLREEITGGEKDSGFLTPLRPLTRSMQYTHGSGIGMNNSTSSETKARIENNFLLTPNTPGMGYDTTAL